MHPDLEKMIPLQALDIEKQRLEGEIAAAPRRVAEADVRATGAAEGKTRLAAELAKEETLRRRLESDIADLRTKLERARKKVDAATTTAQVTALEHETAFARAEIARLEDQELESMERSETLEARLPATEQEVLQATAGLEAERQRSHEMLARDRAALAALNAERQQLRAEIVASPTGEASLARYDRIAGHRGTAIAQAVLGQCGACGMMLRPQLWQDLRDNSADSASHDSLISCENCGRLLYYDPARDAPQRKTPQNESLAAAIVRSSI